jgi:hypothetical protein
MSARYAATARPPGTAIAWAARDGIYVEFPTKEGHPYITRFQKTPDGLQAALNILLEPAPSPPKPEKNHPAVRKPNKVATPEAREAAADIVRKLLLK